MASYESIYVDIASHCIGLGHRKPYHRHGKTFYRPYRNYFTTGGSDSEWDTMTAAGYAEKHPINHGVCYRMTRAGLDWLGKELGMTIYDEED